MSGYDYVGEHIYANFAQNSNLDRREIMLNMYRRKIFELCMNRFEWHGLPVEIDPRFVEEALTVNGLVVFYFDEEYDKFFCFPASIGELDPYNNPLNYRIDRKMIHKTLQASECVPIWSSLSRMIDLDIVEIYSYQLADMSLTINQSIIGLRHPIVLIGDEKSKLTLQNMYQNMVEGAPVMMTYRGFGDNIADTIVPLNLGYSAIDVDKLQVSKARIWNECMNLLGINTANQEKKERVIEAEVEANNEPVSMVRSTALTAREQAAENIRLKFGLDLFVTWKMTGAGSELLGGSE